MSNTKFNILCLDGGGSKGVYTLGVLKEIEKLVGTELHKHFHLIYGTSTGSIIASLLALGETIAEIEKKYFELIPKVMSAWGKGYKSKALAKLGNEIFKDLQFTDFKTDVGIVSMNYDYKRPLIFKSNLKQAHGLKSSFEPGFGCSISDAIQASCAAYPIFRKKKLKTANQGDQVAIDGGFIANNPTLFAVTDATKAFKIEMEDLRIISIGTGNYVEKSISLQSQLLRKLMITQLVERVLGANTNTTEILTKLLYPELKIVRINETFSQPEYGTNMIEKNVKKLQLLNRLGRESFAKSEAEIIKLLA